MTETRSVATIRLPCRMPYIPLYPLYNVYMYVSSIETLLSHTMHVQLVNFTANAELKRH